MLYPAIPPAKPLLLSFVSIFVFSSKGDEEQVYSNVESASISPTKPPAFPFSVVISAIFLLEVRSRVSDVPVSIVPQANPILSSPCMETSSISEVPLFIVTLSSSLAAPLWIVSFPDSE